jgi:hypothetical protein
MQLSLLPKLLPKPAPQTVPPRHFHGRMTVLARHFHGPFMDGPWSLRGRMTVLTRRIGTDRRQLANRSGGGSAPCLRRISAVRIADLTQDCTRMTPFTVQQVWHAGRAVPVGEKGSTLTLVLEATVQRITAAATSPAGCPCCRCSIRIRRTADLQSVTVAVARSDVGEFRTVSRVYCGRCARESATAGCEHRAIALRFRVHDPRQRPSPALRCRLHNWGCTTWGHWTICPK